MIALVIIDLQRWMFRQPARLSQAAGLLMRIGNLVQEFEARRLPIYNVVTIHKQDRSTWSKLMLKHDYACLIEGTTDAEPIVGYCAPESAIRVVKTQNSAFVDTDFEARLRSDGIATLMLTGAFLDGCVGLTAADAAQRRFDVVCVSDAIAYIAEPVQQVLLGWLREMYEIEAISAHDVPERLARDDG